MSIIVSKYEVSTDRKTIQLDIEVGASFGVTSLKLWNENTYKNIALSKDLSSLIDGNSNTESITITANDAGVGYFDGIYIAEIESDDPSDIPGLVATVSLTRFYAVAAMLLANIDLSCLNCNDNFQNATLLDLYIQGMINAIRLGRFRDAIGYMKKINIFEEFACAECSEMGPEVSTPGNLVSIGVVDCILNLDQ